MEQAIQFQLPTSVISPTDIARLVRELEGFDELFRQSELRQDNQDLGDMPRASHLMDEVMSSNGLDLSIDNSRELLLRQLQTISKSAPVLHISFSVDPSGQYVQKIVAWLRSNIDPMALVRVGLQPTIGAGCIVRTANRSFDFSLRQYFDDKHEFFMKKLHQVVQPTLEELEVDSHLLDPRDRSADNVPVEVLSSPVEVAVPLDESTILAQQEIERIEKSRAAAKSPVGVAGVDIVQVKVNSGQNMAVNTEVNSV